MSKLGIGDRVKTKGIICGHPVGSMAVVDSKLISPADIVFIVFDDTTINFTSRTAVWLREIESFEAAVPNDWLDKYEVL